MSQFFKTKNNKVGELVKKYDSPLPGRALYLLQFNGNERERDVYYEKDITIAERPKVKPKIVESDRYHECLDCDRVIQLCSVRCKSCAVRHTRRNGKKPSGSPFTIDELERLYFDEYLFQKELAGHPKVVKHFGHRASVRTVRRWLLEMCEAKGRKLRNAGERLALMRKLRRKQ